MIRVRVRRYPELGPSPDPYLGASALVYGGESGRADEWKEEGTIEVLLDRAKVWTDFDVRVLERLRES